MSGSADQTAAATPIEPEPLPGGLRLRSATAADVDQIADLSAIHHVPVGSPPDEDVRVFVREMLTRPSAQTSLADTLLIDDLATGEIAAKLVMLSHRCTYDGVPFGRGRVEYVTTAPAYRGRGLMTVLFDRYHLLSAERGQAVQVVSGISNYYRRFGYEYALPAETYRSLPRDQLPPGMDHASAFRFRPGTSADIPLLVELSRAAGRRWMVTSDVDAEDWRHELEEMSDANAWRPVVTVVEASTGESIGAAYTLGRLPNNALATQWCELADGVSWGRVGPALLHHLDSLGTALDGRGARFALGPDERSFERHSLVLGDGHPLIELLGSRLKPIRTRPALYVRVADVPAFLRLIAPALERRLAASERHAGHTGQLAISFYRGGLTLRFGEGRLAGVEPWEGLRTGGNDAVFPGLVFLQLLFGHRSMGDLEHAFPDCRALTDDAFALLETIFPKRPSWLWPFF